MKDLSKLQVFFYRNMFVEGSVECDHTGGAIIELVKTNDSIEIKNLYVSCEGYNLANNNFLKKSLSKVYKDSISNNCKIVVPFYFNYSADHVTNEPSEKIKENMAVVIEKYSSSKYTLLEVIVYNQGPATGIIKDTEAQIAPVKRKDDQKVQVSDTTGDAQ